MKSIRAALLALSAALLSACSHTAIYNPSHFQYAPQQLGAKLPGTGAVVMSSTEQAATFSGKPTSFTGGGTNLTLPIGQITKEAALLAFRDVFSEGAVVAEQVEPGKNYTAVIKPTVRSFTYQYNQLKNVGFAITPMTSVSIEVEVSDPSGKSIWSKSVDSGDVEGTTYVVSGAPGEEISKTAHLAILRTLQQQAASFYTWFKANAASLPPPLVRGESL